MRQKVIIAAGGTGGHLFPAQRLAKALKQLDTVDLLFLGGDLAQSPFFEAEQFSHRSILSSPWKGFNAGSIWDLCYKNARGVWQARRAIKSFQPSAVIGFGSFHTLPVMLAAGSLRVPLFQYEANSIPGKVVKLFSSYATYTAGQFPMLKQSLKGQFVPVAMAGKFSCASLQSLKGEALSYFGLDPQRLTLLISGGSQGAEFINRILSEALSKLPFLKIQVIHLIGRNSSKDLYEKTYRQAGIVACVKAFEDKMEFAWAAADLFIGRAGAGTIAELLQAQVPAILIPYPFAADNHQHFNAQFISEVVQGGMVLQQQSAALEKIQGAILKAIESRESWKQALQTYLLRHPLPTLEEKVIEFLHQI